ncbi:hypothetical protein H1235_12710 [Pseudoxanthomonas sp. NC8]|nr:hypothetical protein H1235_12710 [Pseudoxanthomonas sp. NC8]
MVGLSIAEPVPAAFSVSSTDLGRMGDGALATKGAASPAALFLDALAQTQAGSIAFGTARDQLARFLLEAGRAQSPEHVLFSFAQHGAPRARSRLQGAPHEGALGGTRLVPDVLDPWGQQVLGLLGTPRLRHWEWLGSLQGNASVFCGADGQRVLDCWRIVVQRPAAGMALASDAGLAWYEASSLGIAQWAPRHGDVRRAIEEWAVQSLGEPGEDVRKFNPAKARFFHSSQGLVVNGDIGCQLFKIEDGKPGVTMSTHSRSCGMASRRASRSFVIPAGACGLPWRRSGTS